MRMQTDLELPERELMTCGLNALSHVHAHLPRIDVDFLSPCFGYFGHADIWTIRTWLKHAEVCPEPFAAFTAIGGKAFHAGMRPLVAPAPTANVPFHNCY